MNRETAAKPIFKTSNNTNFVVFWSDFLQGIITTYSKKNSRDARRAERLHMPKSRFFTPFAEKISHFKVCTQRFKSTQNVSFLSQKMCKWSLKPLIPILTIFTIFMKKMNRCLLRSYLFKNETFWWFSYTLLSAVLVSYNLVLFFHTYSPWSKKVTLIAHQGYWLVSRVCIFFVTKRNHLKKETTSVVLLKFYRPNFCHLNTSFSCLLAVFVKRGNSELKSFAILYVFVSIGRCRL